MKNYTVESITATEDYYNLTTTELPYKSDDAKYLVVPLVVILVIMGLSIWVYLMAKKRRLNKLRSDIRSLYDFDQNEREWENLNSYNNPYYTDNIHITSSL